jgi:glucosamine--fructose-6-phosphate aminotransferase (isomerizing)
MNPYIVDLLAQPSALRDLLNNYPLHMLDDLHKGLEQGKFDRIIITGMGSSFNAAYPAVIKLCNQAIPVQHINSAELLHYMEGMVGARTLLWMNSQSGRSAEIVRLLDHLKTPSPGTLLSFVNDSSSPLASRSDLSLHIHAGTEATVSTKTYVNMLAINLLAAVQMTGGDMDATIKEMQAAADEMEIYLSNWERQVEQLDSQLGEYNQPILLGRGSSMSAVWNGSLINKEAAKCVFEGMNAAEFRHGPLELVDQNFSAMILAGSPQTAFLNRSLGMEIISHDGRVCWLDTKSDPDLPTLLLPKTSDLTRPLVEILPFQMLTLVMANRNKLQAGKFRYIGKITDRE